MKRLEANFEYLKLRKKEELENEPILEPEIPKPRAYWYEMKSPKFNIEARRYNEHLRMHTSW